MQKLRVSPNGRFLVYEDESPFYWFGDTAWELFHRSTRQDAELYLDKRKSQRFSLIQAVVLAEENGIRSPNAYGHLPLVDEDPAKQNEEYFRHVDWIVQQANSRGLFLGPLTMPFEVDPLSIPLDCIAKMRHELGRLKVRAALQFILTGRFMRR